MQANNKSDVEMLGRSLERPLNDVSRFTIRNLLKAVIAFFNYVINRVYHNRIEGIKAIKLDGPTREIEKITNLSYEEVVKTMEKCQEDGVKVIAYEFKKGTQNVEEEFGKRKSLNKMEQITKANRKLAQLKEFKSKYPSLFPDLVQQRINKWENEKIAAEKAHEGYRYNLAFNKSRSGYMAERIVDIKNLRLNTLDDFSMQNPETLEAIELIKKEGFDLNNEQIREFASEFMSNGDVDLSEFKDDYIVHTVDFKTYSEMYHDLDANEIGYGIQLVKAKDDDENKDKVRIYFKSDKLEQYAETGHLNKGVIQSFGKEKEFSFLHKREEENNMNPKNTEKELVLPAAALKEYALMFRGKDYKISHKDDEHIIVSMSLEDAKEVYETQKKRDPLQEKIDGLEERQKEHLKSLERGIQNATNSNAAHPGDEKNIEEQPEGKQQIENVENIEETTQETIQVMEETVEEETENLEK